MQPTSFRAYAASTALSRRAIPIEQPDGTTVVQKASLQHDVHDIAAEGAVTDGVAAFSSKAQIAYVAFYAGEGDDAVCLGRLDGPFGPGKISVDFADIPEEPDPELAEGEIVIGGTTYRKAD